MRSPARISILIVLLAVCGNCYAQNEPAKFKLRASVSVSADDSIKSEVQSYVNGGLRSLGDVIIVDDAAFQINIVAIKNRTSGQTLGYTFSIVVLKGFEKNMVQGITKSWGKDAAAQTLLQEFFGDTVRLIHHSVLTGPELQDSCKSVVADIDAGPIEDERKQWQEVIDYGKRARELQKQYPNKSLSEIDKMIEAEKKKP